MINVLVVDDSALIRKVLSQIIDAQPDMKVMATAQNPYKAIEVMKDAQPDVITLDIEMPKMDGITFLEKIMRLKPLPVIMVSSLTAENADVTMRALELGAVDFVLKPKLDVEKSLMDYTAELTGKIRYAAKQKMADKKIVGAGDKKEVSIGAKLSADAILDVKTTSNIKTTEKIIAIGASTGGTEAIKEVLVKMPPDCPGIVIAQHMPEAFTKAFATRLNTLCKITVKEAEHGERVLPGHAYIAPGSSHLLLGRSGANYICQLNDGPPVNRHRPSVDVLFRSVANNAGQNTVSAILTGMGKDGAEGMLEILNAGGQTLSQTERTCVVWGMPREAVMLGAVQKEIDIENIAQQLMDDLAATGERAFRV